MFGDLIIPSGVLIPKTDSICPRKVFEAVAVNAIMLWWDGIRLRTSSNRINVSLNDVPL